MKQLIVGFIFVVNLAVPTLSWALSPGDEGWDHQLLQAQLQLYADIADLTPFIARANERGADSIASLRINGVRIELNSAFLELTRSWIRLYYRHLQDECDHCISDPEDVFMQKADDVMGPGFFQRQVGTPVRRAVDDIVVETAEIGSELGNVALVVKVTSEVAETVVSKAVGGGGAHVLCNLIDAALFFALKPLQSLSRIFMWTPRISGHSGLIGTPLVGAWSIVKNGWLVATLKRAERRVKFEVGPVEINQEDWSRVDREGPKRRWYQIGRDGKRAAWLKKLMKRHHRTVDRRDFFGKRFFVVLSRKRFSGYMRGRTPMDEKLGSSKVRLWFLSVQENIIRRGLNAKPLPDEVEELVHINNPVPAPPSEADELRQALVEQYANGAAHKIAAYDGLLRDIEGVFDSTVSAKVRRHRAKILEAVLLGFVYSSYRDVLAVKDPLYGDSWRALRERFMFRWDLGKLANYMMKWSDYLKAASLTRVDSELASGKYEAMEALLKMFAYMESAKILLSVESREEIIPVKEALEGKLNILRAFTPWSEKKTKARWLPWGFGKPLCEDMSLKVSQ